MSGTSCRVTRGRSFLHESRRTPSTVPAICVSEPAPLKAPAPPRLLSARLLNLGELLESQEAALRWAAKCRALDGSQCRALDAVVGDEVRASADIPWCSNASPDWETIPAGTWGTLVSLNSDAFVIDWNSPVSQQLIIPKALSARLEFPATAVKYTRAATCGQEPGTPGAEIHGRDNPGPAMAVEGATGLEADAAIVTMKTQMDAQAAGPAPPALYRQDCIVLSRSLSELRVGELENGAATCIQTHFRVRRGSSLDAGDGDGQDTLGKEQAGSLDEESKGSNAWSTDVAYGDVQIGAAACIQACYRRHTVLRALQPGSASTPAAECGRPVTGSVPPYWANLATVSCRFKASEIEPAHRRLS